MKWIIYVLTLILFIYIICYSESKATPVVESRKDINKSFKRKIRLQNFYVIFCTLVCIALCGLVVYIYKFEPEVIVDKLDEWGMIHYYKLGKTPPLAIILIVCYFIFLLTRIAYVEKVIKNTRVIEEIRAAAEKRKIICEQLEAENAVRLKKEEEDLKSFFDNLYSKYGEPTLQIGIKNTDLQNCFIHFPKTETILICNKPILYKDIISCEVIDNSETITTTIGTNTSESKNKNGNAIGRAIIGGVVAGGVGAIIGGTTGKKEITTQVNTTTKTDVKHDFTINIVVSDLSSPLIKYDCGSDREKMEMISALLYAIIALNKKE